MNDTEFIADLRRSIEAAAELHLNHETTSTEDHQPVARRRVTTLLRRGIAAAVAAAAAAWGVSTLTGSPVAADLTVLHRNGEVTITVDDVRIRPEQIEAAAKEAGINLDIVEKPVGPSNVGLFLSFSGDQLPPTIVPTSEIGGLFAGIRIPENFPTEVTIVRGREARRGETWATNSNALARGEPLACEDFGGLTANQLEAELEGRGFAIRWFFLGESSTEESPQARLHPDWKVISISASGTHSLSIESTPDGRWPYPPGIPQPELDSPC